MAMTEWCLRVQGDSHVPQCDKRTAQGWDDVGGGSELWENNDGDAIEMKFFLEHSINVHILAVVLNRFVIGKKFSSLNFQFSLYWGFFFKEMLKSVFEIVLFL